MPIPMPPPPPPYVAPDLHPIISRDTASLMFVRDRDTGLVFNRLVQHGIWIAAEGGPLELRFHRRADGTVWGEQATYEGGDRRRGVASASASAHVQVLSDRLVGKVGVATNLVKYTIVDSAGRAMRTWSPSTCDTGGTVRLDRPDSPEDPSYLGSWYGCGGTYVLGRMVAVDRGWAMRAPETADPVKPLAAGRYTLRVEVDPLQGIADADRSNNVATMPIRVRSSFVDPNFGGDGGAFPPSPTAPGEPMAAGSRDAHHHEAPEPDWIGSSLRTLEESIDVRRLDARSGRSLARAGEDKLAPPSGVDLPDLLAAPSYGISTSSVRIKGTRRDLLRFGALTWNAGPGPLEVEAFRELGTSLNAYQVFLKDGERVARQQRGTLVWHAAPGHDHFHFRAFARYTLTNLQGAVVRNGGKHSWCIVDTDLVDSTRPGAGATGVAGSGFGSCGNDPGSLWARLSLSVGSGDFYDGRIAGQSFDITKVPNGSYRIRIEANPDGLLAEVDRANNTSLRVVRLGGRPGMRTVDTKPVPTVDENVNGGFGCDFDC